jgi:hypothetical protein
MKARACRTAASAKVARRAITPVKFARLGVQSLRRLGHHKAPFVVRAPAAMLSSRRSGRSPVMLRGNRRAGRRVSDGPFTIPFLGRSTSGRRDSALLVGRTSEPAIHSGDLLGLRC